MARPYEQERSVITAALRLVEADNYARESDPNADAESWYAAEQLALASRALTRATEALPTDDQPIGWNASTTVEETAVSSSITFESLFARHAQPLATVLAATVPGDFDPDSLTPDTFADHLDTASSHVTDFNGAVGELSDDIAAALIYLTDADQTDDPTIRAALLHMASRHLESLDFAASELACW
ncbi:hypothetical protein [Streptacidiphilus rugosus]|uniref:hypothetical protein n=1 Tax=Streptacidiphilus rugosus TaxID=405783 RepID=UPI00055EC0C2|nr:hypothetical protein [Streptacidiphilus rugosus]